MNAKSSTLILILLCAALLSSCRSKPGSDQKSENEVQDPSESLVKANRYLVMAEQEDINNYIRRHKWEMEESGSGLRYWIYKKGDGPKAERGKIAELKYKLWLINGDLVYSSETHGIKTFLIGRGGVETGLEEAILLLHQGDRARLILPSHLAFGLLGDEKRIPPRTAIVYELELINLK
jgi:FKBP-type peptidyl-prolyl cis-trans isomerase